MLNGLVPIQPQSEDGRECACMAEWLVGVPGEASSQGPASSVSLCCHGLGDCLEAMYCTYTSSSTVTEKGMPKGLL